MILDQKYSLGHAIAYVLIYTSKYNDGNIDADEFFIVLKSMRYWMGVETSESEVHKLLIETDELFQSGSNFHRLSMLDTFIGIIKEEAKNSPSILNEIFEDCIFVCASNSSKYDSILKNDQKLLDELFTEYPLLDKLRLKLLG